MAFENFFRGDRDRHDHERDRSRGPSDWNEDRRYSQRDLGRGSYGGMEPDYGRELRGGRDSQQARAGASAMNDYRDNRFSGSNRFDYDQYPQFGAESRNASGWSEDDQNLGASRWHNQDRYQRDYSGGNYERSRGGAGGYRRDENFGGRDTSGYTNAGYGTLGSDEKRSNFRGRGPKEWRRSDDRIREDVCECLTDDPYVDASNIEVNVKDCEVTLTGNVNSRREKRRAEDVIERISGVKDVHNIIRVQEQRASQEQTEAQSQNVRH